MLPAERKQRLRIVYGHTIFGVHEELPGPSAYVTMVREPTAWVLSSYRYLRERSQHRLHESVRKLSLEEFVRTEIAGRDNLQTRMISGRFSEQDPCSKATLELAKRNIDEHFAALGLTERFDETVLLWGQVLGWRKLHYVPRNVTTRGPGGSIPPDVVRLILRVNEFDQQLYRFVVQRFEEQLARHPSVAGDLARFGRQNALFQHLRRARPRRILRRVKRAVLP